MDPREAFVRVVADGSFTAAAQRLGVSTSYVSRSVRALEERLGVSLLARSTRSVQATEAGRVYYARLAPLLQGLEEADLELQAHRAEPRGVLRVAVPHAFGRRWVLPTLLAFQARWPSVQVKAQFSDRFTDPLAADVTIRGGQLPDAAGVVARRLVGFEDLLCASPAFLRRHGVPSSPAELSGLPACRYTGHGQPTPWRLSQGEQEARPEVSAVFEADNGEALVEAACRGFGLILQPDFLTGPALASGALVRVLPAWQGRQGNFWTITPSRLVAATARAFIEALRDDLADAPWNHPPTSTRGAGSETPRTPAGTPG